MSTEAPNWYVTQYNKTAQHKLQSKGFLTRGMAQGPVRIIGNQARFFVLGKGSAIERPLIAQPVKPMNLGKTTIDVTMKHYQAAEYVPHGEPEQMTVPEKDLIAEAGAMAMGRKFDKALFEALDAEGTNIETVGDGLAPMDPILGSTAKAKITGLGAVALNEFYAPLPAMAYEQMKLYKVFSSRDYVGPELPFIKNVEATTWNGVNWFVMPGGVDAANNLLEDSVFSSPAPGQIDTYLWHKSQLGFGSSYDYGARITYENIMTAWLYNATMSGGWKALQTEGIKRLRIKVNAALVIQT